MGCGASTARPLEGALPLVHERLAGEEDIAKDIQVKAPPPVSEQPSTVRSAPPESANKPAPSQRPFVPDVDDGGFRAGSSPPGSFRASPPSRNVEELKKLWSRSFLQADPRQHLVDFFKPGDSRGPYGFLRAKGLRPNGDAAHYFSVWRPTSLTAMRMLYDGTATGKGLNVKGKSALAGPLSGFVPFLQIWEEAHKAEVGLVPVDARTRVFFRSALCREQARKRLSAVALEMEVGSRHGARQLENERAAGEDRVLTTDERRAAAQRATAWGCTDYALHPINDYVPRSIYGLDVPQRVLWETFVVRQDIAQEPGWETGRASEPAFMDLNLHAVRDGSIPTAAVFQDDGRNPLNPRRLLVAHEEADAYGRGNVRPVASDLDCFLIGSKGMAMRGPLPPEQLDLIRWCLNQVENVLERPGSQGWTKRWLEILKKAAFEPPSMPPYGFGDPQSYDIMAKAVEKLQFCGGVRAAFAAHRAPAALQP
jgi:hypothetical protein